MHLRLARRRLTATPGFTIGTIAVLALGTGATLAVFTVLNALVLKTVAVSDPSRLVVIEMQNARGEAAALPRPLFDELAQQQRTLDSVAGYLGGSVVSTEAGGIVHQALVDGVTSRYFRLLAIPVVAGRGLDVSGAQQDGAHADPVAVVREGYARRHFGTPADALGRILALGETSVTIVGVIPDRFPSVRIDGHTDVLVLAPLVDRILGLAPGTAPLRYAFGRLRDDRTLDDVRAEWSTLWQSVVSSSPATLSQADVGERRLVVASGATGVSVWRTRYADALHVTMAASAWLVVIACANLAGLQFARLLTRGREVAVSRALGATEWAVIGPTVLESLLLCLMGLALGAPLAAWGARITTTLLSTSFPLELDLAPDWGTWAVVAALVALVTLLAGLVPAWLAARHVGGLNSGSRVLPASGRIGSTLVAGQVALAVVLLSGAGIAVDALLRVAWRDPGFDADRIVAAQLMNRPGGYAGLDDAVYYRTLVDRIAALPEVAAVALARPTPGLGTRPLQQRVTAAGHAASVDAGVVFASPGYLQVLGLPLLAGRDLTWQDDAAAPRVALISRALARDVMPNGFGEGLRIDVGALPQHRGLDVVGIVEDASVLNVQDPAPRVAYLSALQQPPPMARWPGLLVRTGPGAVSVEAAVTRVLDDLGREFVLRADTLSGHITRGLARERLLAGMALVYGVLALAMVAIGLWALLAQDVTRRLREFGVRLSVGASPAMLSRAITIRALRLTAAGIGLGMALTWMLTRVLMTTLGVDGAGAPWALAGVTGLLLIVAACAAAGPARQAARTEPMAALRSE